MLTATEDDDDMDETLTVIATGPGIDRPQQVHVMVTDNDRVEEPSVYTLSGPADVNVVEGGIGAMVTATANRAVTVDTTVNLMRDRATSTAGDDDFTTEPIVIKVGELTGSTMVMAVEDDMAEDMEELVLYGRTTNMAGEVTGEVRLYLWDVTAPALPPVALILFGVLVALAGARRLVSRSFDW